MVKGRVIDTVKGNVKDKGEGQEWRAMDKNKGKEKGNVEEQWEGRRTRGKNKGKVKWKVNEKGEG